MVGKAKKRIMRKSVKRYSASDIQNIRSLAEMLGAIIPYSGRGKYNLQNVAKDFGMHKYFPAKHHNKKESITHFIREVHKKHPRMLKKIIREILPKGVERRHEQGDPILFEESQSLSDQLYKIGIDLRKEIKDLKLPKSRPSITPPPFEIQEILKKFKLHPILMPDCQKLFIEGHINESVRKALEKYEVCVQKKASLKHKGKDLMAKAFSLNTKNLQINALATESEQNEQEGFMYISMGIMQWWRNTLSHGDEKQISHLEAIGRLFLVSNLLRRLEE